VRRAASQVCDSRAAYVRENVALESNDSKLSIEACGPAQPALDTAMTAAAVAPPKRLRWKRERNGIRRFCGTLDLVLQRFAIVDRQTCGGRRDGLEQARLSSDDRPGMPSTTRGHP
jgi:hypothetical protein